MSRKLVAIESPLAGDFARNIRYARLCCLDALNRGESPYASHLFFTQFLDDRDRGHRRAGIAAGDCWNNAADYVAVYTDLGVSAGMRGGIMRAEAESQAIHYRKLPQELLEKLDKFAEFTPGVDQ